MDSIGTYKRYPIPFFHYQFQGLNTQNWGRTLFSAWVLNTVKNYPQIFAYILTYLLHGAESFLKSNWFAAGHEILLVLWNPKVPHRTHKRPPRIPNPAASVV
jgi:hypothetical protein